MQDSLTTASFFIQAVLAALASAGVLAMYHNLWQVAQTNQTSHSASEVVRFALTILVAFFGIGLMAVHQIPGLGDYSLLTTSVGLVVLGSSLIGTGMHIWESALRIIALLAGMAVSVTSFDMNFSTGMVLALVGAIIAVALTFKGKMVNVYTAFILTVFLGASYWLLTAGLNQTGYQGLALVAIAALVTDLTVVQPHIAEAKAGIKKAKADATARLAVPKAKGADADLVATYTFFVQPMVDATDAKKRLMANELLLRVYDYANNRWAVPQTFDVSIGKQIDMIEKVLERVEVPRVALNMTAEEFVDVNVMHQLTDFARTSDKLEGLIIELTHAPTLEEMQKVAPQYHEADIRIAIDDVGSDNHFEGMQGIMPYLDGVKFAMQNLRRQNDTANLADRMHFWYDLAAEYDIDFIMEGIENKDDENYAKDKLGVQYLQGYYYGRPELPSKG
jgi:EAL domain-containing protein (putative c-di-GMP-specific phosphodiesterase class I)